MSEGALRPCCRDHRIRGTREGVEQAISLGVYLYATRRRERLSQQPAVCGEHLAAALAELLEQARQTLDVGEDKGDGPPGNSVMGPRLRLEEAPCYGGSGSLMPWLSEHRLTALPSESYAAIP